MPTSEQPEDTERPRRHDESRVLRAGLETMAKRAEALQAQVLELKQRNAELQELLAAKQSQ